MEISDKKVARIHYTLTDVDGDIIDSSQGAEPLTYIQGFGNIIPGLEEALVGKAAGDSLQVEITPEKGYGPVVPEMVQTVPRDAFQGVESIDVGMQFQAQTASGPVSVVVKEVSDDTVTVDGNHPLAGQILNFAVQVVDVRDATEEELSHGHVHSDGESCGH